MKRKKRKRIRIKKEPVIVRCNYNHGQCWYKENCPHKKPHEWTVACENDFCSMVKAKAGCDKIQRRK